MAIGDIIVGMDIGTSKVSIVIGEVNNFNQIEVIYTDSQKCRGIKKGKIIDEDEIVLAVTKLIKNAEIDELNMQLATKDKEINKFKNYITKICLL